MKITDIFDYFSAHRKIRGGSLMVLSVIFVSLLLTLRFSEDISDFLPLGTKEREQMSIYRNISGADKLFILFSNPGDADYTVEAIETFIGYVKENDPDHLCEGMTSQVDMESITAVANFVYENIPLFLNDKDYERMDSLLSVPGYMKTALEKDRQVLMFPSSALVANSISHDPLGLFSPVMERLQSSDGQQGFEIYDNYIFTPDMSRAVVMLDSPFGSSETENNSRLIKFLESACGESLREYPDVSTDIIGGPAIAVGNSSRIKKDSIIAISLSIVLIVLLLAYSFNSLRNILLIFLTVGWGAIFALGGMALFRSDVSIIVIGISSVIIGIAINYPLHLVSHIAHQPDRRQALKEIVSPLVTGNVTTVGAFLALTPLKSTALRDLGLFASLLLIGTIIFVLIYLPHYVSTKANKKRDTRLLDRIAGFSPENKGRIILCTVIMTAVLLVFSFHTEFDPNMSHINYMTESQSRDMQYFEDLLTKDESRSAQTLYIYGRGSTYEDALCDIEGTGRLIEQLSSSGKIKKQNEALSFLVSEKESARRSGLWKSFIERHYSGIAASLRHESAKAGFSAGAFSDFMSILTKEPPLTISDADFFKPLTGTVFSQSLTMSEDGRTAYVVCPVNVEPSSIYDVRNMLGNSCFEVAEINSAMTRSLSDNFNYIGLVCSLIVFFFLWFSFGRLELAIISFLPMAISWIWILGLMALLGIKFNIVNIILATFIFGQGDDYTIFMTEGCQYEYARRQPILKSYKCSIIQSASIMFVGIGTLIVARHPAMRSLAEVTIIGMFSVVFMAYMIPPLMFKLLTARNSAPLLYPRTLKALLFGTPHEVTELVEGRYIYKGKEIERSVRLSLREKGKEIIDSEAAGRSVWELDDDGYGELSILFAKTHPDVRVIAHLNDNERKTIATIAADGFVDNIEFRTI